MNLRTLAAGVLAAVALCIPVDSHAADLTVSWDPATDGVTTGYVVFYGTSSQSYSSQVDAGNVDSYVITNLMAGTAYYLVVRAYDASGVMSPPSPEAFAMTAQPPPQVVTSVALTSSLPSPQTVGTTVNWSATASGGIQPYQFQWSLYDGTTWTVGAWNSTSIWAWTPIAAKQYQVRVGVRSYGSTSATGELVQTVPFTATAPQTSVSLRSNMLSPQPLGTTVVWSATASGGVAPYQYRWWIFDGKNWNAATSWITSSTWSWTPSAANSNYVVGVDVRSAGNLANAIEASASVPFAIKVGTKGGCQGPKCK